MNIRLATGADIDGILTLLLANHANTLAEAEKKDGFVTTNMTAGQMLRLIESEHGITVAERDGRILAFAMAGSWDFWKEWPMFAYMMELLPRYLFQGMPLDTKTSYQYGPICVDRSVRGTGVFERVFSFSLTSMRDRFPVMVTFVNQINPRSYHAHSVKAGMSTPGTFEFNGNHYYLMACATNAS